MLSNFTVALAVVCALFAQSHAKTYFKVRLAVPVVVLHMLHRIVFVTSLIRIIRRMKKMKVFLVDAVVALEGITPNLMMRMVLL